MLKSALFAPIPSPIARIAATANPGLRIRTLSANRESRQIQVIEKHVAPMPLTLLKTAPCGRGSVSAESYTLRVASEVSWKRHTGRQNSSNGPRSALPGRTRTRTPSRAPLGTLAPSQCDATTSVQEPRSVRADSCGADIPGSGSFDRTTPTKEQFRLRTRITTRKPTHSPTARCRQVRERPHR